MQPTETDATSGENEEPDANTNKIPREIAEELRWQEEHPDEARAEHLAQREQLTRITDGDEADRQHEAVKRELKEQESDISTNGEDEHS